MQNCKTYIPITFIRTFLRTCRRTYSVPLIINSGKAERVSGISISTHISRRKSSYPGYEKMSREAHPRPPSFFPNPRPGDHSKRRVSGDTHDQCWRTMEVGGCVGIRGLFALMRILVGRE